MGTVKSLIKSFVRETLNLKTLRRSCDILGLYSRSLRVSVPENVMKSDTDDGDTSPIYSDLFDPITSSYIYN